MWGKGLISYVEEVQLLISKKWRLDTARRHQQLVLLLKNAAKQSAEKI
jgi:hypothetical protein